jgi:origin recognition complex subunit 3
VQFAYMSHFFANPLTSLLAKGSLVDYACPELAEAIRNTPSFRQ